MKGDHWYLTLRQPQEFSTPALRLCVYLVGTVAELALECKARLRKATQAPRVTKLGTKPELQDDPLQKQWLLRVGALDMQRPPPA